MGCIMSSQPTRINNTEEEIQWLQDILARLYEFKDKGAQAERESIERRIEELRHADN